MRRPPRYDLPNAAPEPLRLVQLFVNTVDKEHGREWLGTVRELREWLRARGLPASRVTRADLERAHELRAALRSLLRANNDARIDPAALDVLNRSPVFVQLDAGAQPRLEPEDPVLGPIVAVAVAAMLDGSWSRLKACRNCSWAFYDPSRNRAGTWCSMAICGNRAKTRAYRRRRARS